MKKTRWFRLPVNVQYRDVDFARHANNAVYLHYLEDARMEFLKCLCRRYDIDDLDFVVASLKIDYRSPAAFRERLLVHIHPTKIGQTSWTFDFKITEKKTHRLICDGESVQVLYDYESAKKRSINRTLRKKLSEWM